jgi:hypothetical protein
MLYYSAWELTVRNEPNCREVFSQVHFREKVGLGCPPLFSVKKRTGNNTFQTGFGLDVLPRGEETEQGCMQGMSHEL